MWTLVAAVVQGAVRAMIELPMEEMVPLQGGWRCASPETRRPPIHLGGSRNPSLSQKSLAQGAQGTWAGVKDSK